MHRRAFIGTLAGGLLAAPLVAEAQAPARVPRVGYVFSRAPSEAHRLWDAARQGLRELGYVEGQNIALEVRWAEGRYERLPELVAEMVRLNGDVLVVASTPGALAVKKATQAIPVVMVAVSDPVGSGLVASLARPGSKLHGASHAQSGDQWETLGAAQGELAEHFAGGRPNESG